MLLGSDSRLGCIHTNTSTCPRSMSDICTYTPQPSSHRSKGEFCTKQSLQLHHPISHFLKVCSSAPLVSPYHTCPVAFWSLSAFEQLQGQHHQRHIRCLSGVWSGTTLRRTSVQLSKPSDATHSARFVGQPGHGRRLPRPGQLMIGEESPGYHNNNNQLTMAL